jgi:FkbM family methyltransferase
MAMRRTYAYDAEDILIEKLIGKVDSFIDIGANDGINMSNTYLFARRGAKGLCYEPIPSIFAKLEKNLADCDEVFCCNQAVSSECRQVNMVDAGVLSHIEHTADEGLICKIIKEPPYQVRNVWVNTKTMLEVINDFKFHFWNLYCRGEHYPDLVSIDVEGHEHCVLTMWPGWFRPKTIIIETHNYNEKNEMTWKHKHYDEIIEKVVNKLRYGVAEVTAMNTIFIRKDSV